MNEKDLIVVREDGENSGLVRRAILNLPAGFFPELVLQLYSADYVKDRNLVRIACAQRFDFELPRGAKWVSEQSRTFAYRKRNYQLLFWEGSAVNPA